MALTPRDAKPEEPKDSKTGPEACNVFPEPSKTVSADCESMKDTVLQMGQKVHSSEALFLLLEKRLPRQGEPFFLQCRHDV